MHVFPNPPNKFDWFVTCVCVLFNWIMSQVGLDGLGKCAFDCIPFQSTKLRERKCPPCESCWLLLWFLPFHFLIWCFILLSGQIFLWLLLLYLWCVLQSLVWTLHCFLGTATWFNRCFTSLTASPFFSFAFAFAVLWLLCRGCFILWIGYTRKFINPQERQERVRFAHVFFNLNFAKLCLVLFSFSLCLCCCLLWCCLCFSFWISRSSSLPFSFSPTSSPSPPFALRFFVFRIRPSILPTLPFELVKTKLGSPIDLSWEAMLVKNKFKANLGWRLNRWLGAFEKKRKQHHGLAMLGKKEIRSRDSRSRWDFNLFHISQICSHMFQLRLSNV